jgi:hypothetical protein
MAGEDLTRLALAARFRRRVRNFFDTPASSEHLASFKDAPEYVWQDCEKPPEQYATFNEFFGRKFEEIDVQRPVAAADDDRVIVFPSESSWRPHRRSRCSRCPRRRSARRGGACGRGRRGIGSAPGCSHHA